MKMFPLINVLTFLSIATITTAKPLFTEHSLVKKATPAQPINFVGVDYDGTGCPPGSIIPGKLDLEKYEYQYFYKKLTASISPESPEGIVVCQVKLTFNTTAASQLFVIGGSYRGHVNIDQGVYAIEDNRYQFVGSDSVAEMAFSFEGPLDADTEFTNVVDSTLNSGCASAGGEFTLVVTNYLGLKGDGKGSGSISISELDQSVLQSIKLDTQPC